MAGKRRRLPAKEHQAANLINQQLISRKEAVRRISHQGGALLPGPYRLPRENA